MDPFPLMARIAGSEADCVGTSGHLDFHFQSKGQIDEGKRQRDNVFFGFEHRSELIHRTLETQNLQEDLNA